MFYTICPHCGYKLFRAEEGARIEVFYPKCKAKLLLSQKRYPKRDGCPTAARIWSHTEGG